MVSCFQIWETIRQEFTAAGDICVSLKLIDTQPYLDIRRVFKNDSNEILFTRAGVCMKTPTARELFGQMKRLTEAVDGTILQRDTVTVLKRGNVLYFSKFDKEIWMIVNDVIEVSDLVNTLL